MVFMEHQFLDYKSPLHERRTIQPHIKPFSVFEAQKLLPGASAQSIVELHAAVEEITRYYIFSKSEFTDSCRTQAKADGNVELITLEEMLR